MSEYQNIALDLQEYETSFGSSEIFQSWAIGTPLGIQRLFLQENQD